MLPACCLLRAHYLDCSLMVRGWPVGDGPTQRLDFRFLEPLLNSVEISLALIYTLSLESPFIRLKIGTRQCEQSPSGFLLWFPRRELTNPGLTDH